MKAMEVTRAKLWCLDNDKWNFEFPFNPEFGSMSLKRGDVGWKPVGGGFDPWGGPLEYDEGGPDSLDFTILLDETTVGDPDPADALAFEANFLAALATAFTIPDSNTESVLPQIADLWKLTVPIMPDGHSADNYQVRPPLVAFVWDQFEFLGAVTSLSADLLLFTHDGVPKRAKVSIGMNGRAFSGNTSMEDFLTGTYTPPSLTGTGSRVGQATRDDLLKLL